MKCDAGLTAEEWARKEGHEALAGLIARGGEEESDEEVRDQLVLHALWYNTAGHSLYRRGINFCQDDGAISDDADPNETSTQRSRRKRRELAAQESRGAKAKDVAADDDEAPRAGSAAAGGGGDEHIDAAPTWPEVVKALESGQKELIINDARSSDGADWVVDPALWRCTGLNLLNMSLKAPASLRSLPDGIGSLTGLRTLILSNNALTTLPEAIATLRGLKVLELAFNQLTSLPSGFGRLEALETLLLAHNQLTSVAPLAGCTNLVSLTLDSNSLTQLDDAAFERKPRLALLSARSNKLGRLPPELGECSLLQSVFVKGNAIHDVPFELSGLKKLKDLELDDNPLDDPKIKKMIKNPAGLIKEIVPYLKKRGKTAASEPLARTVAAAPAPAPPVAKPAAPQSSQPAPAAGSRKDDDDDDDDDAGGKKLSKKERAKLERKALEEKQLAALAARAQQEQQAAAEAQRRGGDDDDDDGGDDGGDDDDDDEAELVRRRRPQAFLYALDPEERERLEREEAQRLRAAKEAKEAAEAAARAEAEAAEMAEAEKRMKALAVKEARSSEGIAWVFTAGVIQKVPASSLPAGSAARAKASAASKQGASETYYELLCEVPGICVGRIIGKAGATIKEITARSGARINVQDAGAAAPGMAHVTVAGRPEALESARMLLNNALASKR